MNVPTVSQNIKALNHRFETSHPLKILEWTYQNRSKVEIDQYFSGEVDQYRSASFEWNPPTLVMYARNACFGVNCLFSRCRMSANVGWDLH